ncbi:hypothetical protein T439DRAFT_356762 [Meredithblackwellia eburnea MCA 4105]
MSSSIIASIPLDKLLGSLLIGSWISVFLYAIEIIQSFRYFSQYCNDGLFIKCTVAFALATDLVNTVIPCLTVYKYCISHWGDVMFLLVQPIYFAIQLVSTLLSANITQIYLTLRIWRLLQTSRIRQPTLQFAVMGVLGMFILTLNGVGVWVTNVLLRNRSTLLVGSWVNAALYLLEIVQVYRYFTLFPNDELWLKFSVSLSNFFDTASTIVYCMAVYLYTITIWGNIIALLTQPIHFTLLIIGILASGAIAQVFLTTFFSYSDREKAYNALILWLSVGSSRELVHAALIVFLLRRLQAEKELLPTSAMGPIIKRILTRSIESGTVTATLALLALATFVYDKESNAEAAIAICVGRVYTLMMLAHLIGRNQDRNEQENSEHWAGWQSGRTTSRKGSHKFAASQPQIPVNTTSTTGQQEEIALENLGKTFSSNPGTAVFHVTMAEPHRITGKDEI